MSSNYEFNIIESKKICRVCLASGDTIYAMTNSEIFAYREVVPTSTYEVVCNYSEMFLCIYCRYMLRKIQKFVQQCIRAEELLTNCHEQPSLFVAFLLAKEESKLSVELGPETGSDIVQSIGPSPRANANKIDEGDDSDGDYDDDVPLVMFKTDEEPVKKKEDQLQKKEEVLNSTETEKASKTTEPYETQSGVKTKNRDTKKSKPKRQKVVKEGFSSRMVQETDEYVVIKLTKEQVLKEMEERSKSDEYQRSLYKCEKCVKGFNFEEVLLTHMDKHTGQNGWLKCEICSQYCPSAVSLRGHMKSHTTRYSCKICGIQLRARQHLLEHYSISHTENSAIYQCKTCPFTTNKRTVMQRHGRSHAASSRHPCPRCGELFKTVETLRVHTQRHSWCAFKCSQCSERFVHPVLLRRHERSHTQTDYYCVECDLKFKTSDNLRIHFKRAKRHRDASSYKHSCPQCPQKFMTLSSLAGHLSAAHGVPKQHSCDICHREYSTRSAVRAHMRSAHAQHKPREDCRVCARTETRKSVPCGHLGAHRQARVQKEENSLINEMAQDIPNEG